MTKSLLTGRASDMFSMMLFNTHGCHVCCTGAKDNLWNEVGRAIKAGFKVYARELPAPLGGALTEKAVLKGYSFQWNDKCNGGRFNGPLDAFDQEMLAQ